MTQDIDTNLMRLACEPAPARLASIEDAAFRQIARSSLTIRELPTRVGVATATAALLMGVAIGMIPTEPADSERSLSPIGGAADLAPSTLLTRP